MIATLVSYEFHSNQGGPKSCNDVTKNRPKKERDYGSRFGSRNETKSSALTGKRISQATHTEAQATSRVQSRVAQAAKDKLSSDLVLARTKRVAFHQGKVESRKENLRCIIPHHYCCGTTSKLSLPDIIEQGSKYVAKRIQQWKGGNQVEGWNSTRDLPTHPDLLHRSILQFYIFTSSGCVKFLDALFSNGLRKKSIKMFTGHTSNG